MSNATDDNVLRYLKKTGYNDKICDHVAGIFDRLNLPLPHEGEFFQTNDRGILVLINRYALALRFTTCAHPNYVHPNILQPLVTFPDDILRGDLFPGVKTPHIKFTDCNIMDFTDWVPILERIKEKLEKGGIEVLDNNFYNGAVLPPPYEDHDILIDPGAVRALNALSGIPQEVREALKKRRELDQDDPQQKLFGGLKAAFQKAIANDNDAALASAWQQCRDMKARGLLVAAWENIDYSGTQGAAEKYERRLQTVQPALP